MGPPPCGGGWLRRLEREPHPRIRLQWGRLPAEADGRPKPMKKPRKLLASMGPPPCGGGWRGAERRADQVPGASMGPPPCGGGWFRDYSRTVGGGYQSRHVGLLGLQFRDLASVASSTSTRQSLRSTRQQLFSSRFPAVYHRSCSSVPVTGVPSRGPLARGLWDPRPARHPLSSLATPPRGSRSPPRRLLGPPMPPRSAHDSRLPTPSS